MRGIAWFEQLFHDHHHPPVATTTAWAVIVNWSPEAVMAVAPVLLRWYYQVSKGRIKVKIDTGSR